MAYFKTLQPSVVDRERSGVLLEVAVIENVWPSTILQDTEGVLETTRSFDLAEDDSHTMIEEAEVVA